MHIGIAMHMYIPIIIDVFALLKVITNPFTFLFEITNNFSTA